MKQPIPTMKLERRPKIGPPGTGSHRRTPEAIFRHPLVNNLEWSDVVAHIEKIGEVDQNTDSGFAFVVSGESHIMHRPRVKDLTVSELIDLRQFLTRAGWSPEPSSQSPVQPGSAAPNLMIVVDHHSAKIFHIDVTSDDVSKHVIKPYDPHHFLHHLAHRTNLGSDVRERRKTKGFMSRSQTSLRRAVVS